MALVWKRNLVRYIPKGPLAGLPVEPDKLPLVGPQVERTSPLAVATRVEVVTRAYQDNTPLVETGKTVVKKRQIVNLTGNRSARPAVESRPATLAKHRASGFPLSWGKPERFGGCFDLTPRPALQRPHRGDYMMLRECIL